jgi:putative nucleotidyltransferase with HDIG domain
MGVRIPEIWVGRRIMNKKNEGNGERSNIHSLFDFIKNFFKKIKAGKHLSILYLVAFWVLSLLLFPPTKKVEEIRFKENDIANVDVIAPFTFRVPYSEQEIETSKANAAVNVFPVYEKKDISARLSRDVINLKDKIDEISARDTLEIEEPSVLIQDLVPGIKEENERLLLRDDLREKIFNQTLQLQKKLFDRGIINDGSPLRRKGYLQITVVDGNRENILSTRKLIEQDGLERFILNQGKQVFGENDKILGLFYNIVRSHLSPNLIYNHEETQARRDKAIENIPESFTISKNQRIISKHDKVTKRQVNILQAMEEKKVKREVSESGWQKLSLFVGKGLRIIILLFMLAFSLNYFSPDIIDDTKKVTLVFIVLIFYMLLLALIVRTPSLSPYLIPAPFVSMVFAAFFGVLAAAIFAIFSGVMILTHTNLPPQHLFISIFTGIVAITTIAKLRERKNFYTVFLYISIAYVAGVFSFAVTEGESTKSILFSSIWGITNSLFCTIIVMFLLPVFESMLGMTTNFTLMELSDLNRPLLKRLILEAPGTYHHSILVGNLVEAVASDIGANGLLSRVAAYYHDIGKLEKPDYFFENKRGMVNKHEKLTPSMSALVLSAHVKDGINLAKKEKLPPVIIDAIREHHGTTVMEYFYNKALEYDSKESVNIGDFKYSGPKPQSRENALIMLADSSEAAARSLKEPTEPRIRAVVGKIFEERMSSGELDQSGLTLNDIAKVKEKFIQLLTSVFHPRVSYPQKKEKKGQGANESNSK